MANNLDAFIPEIWSRRVIANIDQVNVALNFVNRNYEGEIREQGDTVRVRTFGNIIVGDYTRGSTIAPQSMVPTMETMTIDTSKYFAIDLDDLDRAQNDINALAGYTQRAGVAMSNAIDTFVFGAYSLAYSANVISNGGSAIDITSSTATTAVWELMIDAQTRLNNLDVPRNNRWIIVTPYVESLLLKSTTYFVRASALGDRVVTTARFDGGMAGNTPGFVGQVAGFDVYTSNNLPTNGANRYCLYGQGTPISYAGQIPQGTMEAMRLENTFGTRVRGLLLHGKAVFAEDSKRLGYIYVDNS